MGAGTWGLGERFAGRVVSGLKHVSMCRGAFPDEITRDSWILAPDSSVSISPVRG